MAADRDRVRTPRAVDPQLEMWLVLAAVAVVAGVALLALATGVALAGVLSGHGWVWPVPRTWPDMLAGIAEYPATPARWFPDHHTTATGPAWLTYTCTATLAAGVAVLVGWAYRRARGRRHDTFRAGLATATQVDHALSLRAMRRRAEHVRPDLTVSRRTDPRQLGSRIGRDVHSGQMLYRSHEDTTYIVGPPRSGKTHGVLIAELLDAPGAAVATSLRPDLLLHTITTRATGERPVWVFDPTNISLWPDRLRWSPVAGCREPAAAIRRAHAMVMGARDPADQRGDADWRRLASDVLRCYLHAAALAGGDIADVLRWAAKPREDEPVAILARSTAGTAGWAAELDNHRRKTDRIRQSIWLGVDAALAAFADPDVLTACTPTRRDQFTVDRLIDEAGTLYVLGSTDHPGVEAITSALLAEVFVTAKRRADHSPTGRLSPPLLPLLEEAANIALIWNLPSLMSYGGGSGLPFTVVFQSPAQARDRWGTDAARAMWDAATYKLILPGMSVPEDLEDLSKLIGDTWIDAQQVTRSWAYRQHGATEHQVRAIPPDRIRNLTDGHGLLIPRSTPPVHVQLPSWTGRPDAAAIRAGYHHARQRTGRIPTTGNAGVP